MENLGTNNRQNNLGKNESMKPHTYNFTMYYKAMLFKTL